jgi:hypothetical protein
MVDIELEEMKKSYPLIDRFLKAPSDLMRFFEIAKMAKDGPLVTTDSKEYKALTEQLSGVPGQLNELKDTISRDYVKKADIDTALTDYAKKTHVESMQNELKNDVQVRLSEVEKDLSTFKQRLKSAIEEAAAWEELSDFVSTASCNRSPDPAVCLGLKPNVCRNSNVQVSGRNVREMCPSLCGTCTSRPARSEPRLTTEDGQIHIAMHEDKHLTVNNKRIATDEDVAATVNVAVSSFSQGLADAIQNIE